VIDIRHITLPAGFVACGVHCGIKSTRQEDLAIIAGEGDVSAALLTTSNQVIGEPVRWCRKVLAKGYGRIRGIVINAGNSNVCTGRQGRKDAEAMAAETAERLGVEARQILVASTGIIGRALPMAKIRSGIAAASGALGWHNDRAVIRAIMTTDTREKSAVVQTRIGGQPTTLAGIVKGAGMIAPSVATMIAVITTDADIAPRTLHGVFKSAADASFNAVTVDSDQSTSDTALAMASGLAGGHIAAGSADERKFADALAEVCTGLATSMARDGEGATRLIRVCVTGAAGDADAKIAAKAVADSPLVKCAVHGGDPNWGRIAAAVGRSAAKVVQEKLSVRIGGVTIFSRGLPKKFKPAAVARHLSGETVEIDVGLGVGRGKFTAYACDLSRQYVAINADYHT
jgi:glutamate N-acetyltransferase/amino-acid N-acetyltransferase